LAARLNGIANQPALTPGWFRAILRSALQWLSRFAENRMATAGLVFVVFIILVAIFAPQIALYDPDLIDIEIAWRR